MRQENFDSKTRVCVIEKCLVAKLEHLLLILQVNYFLMKNESCKSGKHVGEL